MWSPTGRELFYRGSGTLMVAPIDTQGTFTHGTPEFLLSTRGYANRRGPRFYDISPDGRLFLLTKGAADTSTPAQIVVIQDWFEELRERVPTN